jgi:hypothetical protein
MKTLLLTVLLCGWAGVLLAQPQLAQRTDTTAAAPVWVPVPAAVRQACQRQLPTIAANPKASWEAYENYVTPTSQPVFVFEVLSEQTLAYRYQSYGTSWVDTLYYTLEASFDNTGHLRSFDKEVAADTLPPPVRRAVQRLLKRYPAGSSVLLVVASIRPYLTVRSSRTSYRVWVCNAENPSPHDSYVFWRNGELFQERPERGVP